ncbi:MAG: hypothetical protein SGPRY_000930 [Prymnesium sp.]
MSPLRGLLPLALLALASLARGSPDLTSQPDAPASNPCKWSWSYFGCVPKEQCEHKMKIRLGRFGNCVLKGASEPAAAGTAAAAETAAATQTAAPTETATSELLASQVPADLAADVAESVKSAESALKSESEKLSNSTKAAKQAVEEVLEVATEEEPEVSDAWEAEEN